MDTRSFIPDLTAPAPKPTGSMYRKVPAGNLPYPSKCAGCGTSNRDCLDFNFQLTDIRIPLDRSGAVLLCTQCFRNAADVMGYIPVELAELNVMTAVDQVLKEDAQRKLVELNDAAVSLITAIEEKIDVYHVLHTSIFAGNFHSHGDSEVEMDMEPSPGSGMDSEELPGSTEEITGEITAGTRTGSTEEELGLIANDSTFSSTERQIDSTAGVEGPNGVSADTSSERVPTRVPSTGTISI